MGLSIYISSDKLVPKKYRIYDEEGIKGKWLLPYRRCRHPDDGLFAAHVTNYLETFPNWEDVYIYNTEAGLAKCWTKAEHDNFHEALVFYAKHDSKSMIIMDW